MDGYICTKSLTLSSNSYTPGDSIPAEAVLPSRVRVLTKQGYIAPMRRAAALAQETPQEGTGEPTPIVIPVMRDGGVYELLAMPDTIVAATCNLQLTAEESIKAIETMTDTTALILIHALDSRKTVKAAAQARAEALESQTDGGAHTENKGNQEQGDA